MEAVLFLALMLSVPFLARVRSIAQPVSSESLERAVAGMCERRPELMSASGLSAGDFTVPEHRERMLTVSAAATQGRLSRVPRRDMAAALALREDARERSSGRVYVGLYGLDVAPDGTASWVPSPLSAWRFALTALFLAAGWFFAASTGQPVWVSLLFASLAAVVSLVDLDTLLVDMPSAALLLLISVSLAAFSVSSAALPLVLVLVGVSSLSACGSAAVLLRRARSRTFLLLDVAFLLLGVSFSLAVATYPWALSETPSTVSAMLHAVPAPLVASWGRMRALSTSVEDVEGEVRLVEGPSSGVGDGDLVLLVPLLVVLSLSPLVAVLVFAALAPLLLLVMFVLRRLAAALAPSRLSLSPSPSSPLPFGPPLLMSALLSPGLSGTSSLPVPSFGLVL